MALMMRSCGTCGMQSPKKKVTAVKLRNWRVSIHPPRFPSWAMATYRACR
jgi:hypothetical protein